MALPATPQHSDAGGDDATAADVPTRERLLRAAYDLLVANGYQATTVQAVARRAGLTTGAIYANFGGKQDLMAHAVLDAWYRTERNVISEQVAGLANGAAPGIPPDADTFTRLLAGHLAAPPAPGHQLLTEVTGAIVRDDLAESPLLVSVRFVEEITRASIEAGKAAGTISPRLSTDAIVAVTVSTYLGAITSKALGLPQPDFAEALDVLRAATSGYADG